MRYTKTLELAVPAAQVWATLSAVQDWPEWTPTVEWVRTDGTGLNVGATVSVKQPGRRVARYTVDVVEPGRRFRWGSNRMGVRQWADHTITPTGPAACHVELTFAMSGPIGGLLGRLGASTIRRMVDTEAASLRTRLDPAA